MTNPICTLLGIRYPIFLGGMLYVGRARLVAAVSEAGGLGILGAGRLRPQELTQQIESIRQLTEKPFGINIPLHTTRPEALIEAAQAAGATVFATSGGSPAKVAGRIKATGAKLIQVVASVRQARSAEAAGVDVIVAEGGESGGMVSKDLVTTLALVPQVAAAVHLPVAAAGGIADGRGMAAAFALGARGIQMGTRFLASAECEIPFEYKQALVMAEDTDTRVFTNASGVGRRALKKELLQRISDTPEEKPTADAAEDRHHQDNEEYGSVGLAPAAGQSAGLVCEVLSAGEIIQRIIAQAHETAAGLRQHFDFANSSVLKAKTL